MHLLMCDSMTVYARVIEVKRGMRYRSRGGGVGTMKGSVIRQADDTTPKTATMQLSICSRQSKDA